MTVSPLLGLEILAGTLASNIEAYAAAGAKAKRYKLYAICRRQESERRQIYAIIAEWLSEQPQLPISSRAARTLRRLRMIFKLRCGDERAAMSDLRREDADLMATIRAFADQGSLPFTIFDAIKRLANLVLGARSEFNALWGERARSAARARDPQVLSATMARAH